MYLQPRKSPGKKRTMKMSWKNPGNSLRIRTKLKSSIFREDFYPSEPFFSQIIILENLNFDLEKSWKSPGKMDMKK